MAHCQWDHTIHVVNHLDQPIQQFHNHGLYAARGGSHQAWGTCNALSYFGLHYVEFLSVENRKLAEQTESYNVVAKDTIRYLPEREALTRVVLRTNHLEQSIKRATTAGIKVSPIMPGRRLNAQGNWIEWRMATLYGDFHGLNYPFLIEWKDSDAQRLRDLTEAGAIRSHPLGEIAVDHAVFTVYDPKATAAHWQRVFGLEAIQEQGEETIIVPIGDKSFWFEKGSEPGVSELVLRTNQEAGEGTSFTFGEGRYTLI